MLKLEAGSQHHTMVVTNAHYCTHTLDMNSLAVLTVQGHGQGLHEILTRQAKLGESVQKQG